MRRVLAGLLIALLCSAVEATTNTYQEGVSGPADSADIDTALFQGSPTTNFGTSATSNVGTISGNALRMTSEYVISDIAPGATITACTLRISVSAVTAPTAGHIFRLCGEHWLDGNGQGELQATWNIWKTANNWSAAGAGDSATACGSGGDVTTTNGVAYTAPAGTGNFTFPDMTALCQDALDNRSGHLRIRISQDTEGAGTNEFDFTSSDGSTAALRPLLTVTFTAGTTTTTTSTSTSTSITTTTSTSSTTSTTAAATTTTTLMPNMTHTERSGTLASSITTTTASDPVTGDGRAHLVLALGGSAGSAVAAQCQQSLDGTNWTNVGSSVSALGPICNVDFPIGKYRANVTTCTGCNVSVRFQQANRL